MKTIRFKNEKSPFNIMAENDRYKICVRKLNKRQDNRMLWFEVERGGHSSFMEAYNHLKDHPVYTIVDLVEKVRGPDNLVFGIYDYFKKSDCEKALEDLIAGKLEISHRNRVELNIN